MGKPIMTINAADCWALPAMAAKKVNTKLILAPPKIVIPKNCNTLFSGLPNSNVNAARLSKLITIINNKLNNSLLILFNCSNNLLTTLNVSTCTNLSNLYCYYNQLGTLDVSGNNFLIHFYASNNVLTSLNMQNGNNINLLEAEP